MAELSRERLDEGGSADGWGGLSAKEYNELVDRYNKRIDDKAELERKNREKAYEVMYQQEHSR